MNNNFNKPCVISMQQILSQLKFLHAVKLQANLFVDIPRQRLKHYLEAFKRLSPSHLKQKNEKKRYFLLSCYFYMRKQEILDQALDMFNVLTNKIVRKSIKKAKNRFDNHSLTNERAMLYKMSVAALNNPDITVKDCIYPAVGGTGNLQHYVKRYSNKKEYKMTVHKNIAFSYAMHYRRMIKEFLTYLQFESSNSEYHTIFQRIDLILKYFDSSNPYFPKKETIDLDFIPKKLHSHVTDENGRIKRTVYEVYNLKQLSNYIKCREVWVEESFKHGNPHNIFPSCYADDPDYVYKQLNHPKDPDEFIEIVLRNLDDSLSSLNKDIPSNTRVSINKKELNINLSLLKAQKESPNLPFIKELLKKKWGAVELINVLKEVEIKLKLTRDFVSYGDKVYLTEEDISERLLLILYSFGTNIDLEHICASNKHISYAKLRHVKNYFLTKDNLKNAINRLANELLTVRNPKIWGNSPVAIACDSTQFSSYCQNMISEYHNRYGGRGIMIYWHVEKKATCIKSQLKSVSSSEVAYMMNGILQHCTVMSVEKSYVDTHGQSEVGFAFSYLLGFQLMPRLANIKHQKLYMGKASDKKTYSNISSILKEEIDWPLIRKHYDQIAKYALVMLEGPADPESVLRRFTKNNLKNPVYLALSQLGKAIKTIFICQYLMHESIRQEINEGLNVVELWNGVSKYIFFGRSGEISSNELKTQELSVLCLHLLQLSMVYINTLMVQQIIEENSLLDILTPEDLRAITPLIYEHINPYGLIYLDFTKRIPHFANYNEYARAA